VSAPHKNFCKLAEYVESEGQTDKRKQPERVPLKTPPASYGERLKEARAFAKLSQAELASAVGVKQQTIQYLENPQRSAAGSKHTAAIARICKVNADWLATGHGKMHLAMTADLGTEDGRRSIELVETFRKLSPDTQQWLRELIFTLAMIETNYPWLRKGRPRAERYAEYEKRIRHHMDQEIARAARHLDR
jgi:transcriptional regulator with XRE-family HTH domain